MEMRRLRLPQHLCYARAAGRPRGLRGRPAARGAQNFSRKVSRASSVHTVEITPSATM
jgi:hypothetical protein